MTLPTPAGIIAALPDEQMKKDCRVLMAMMRRISGKNPKVWNVATIGFGSYHFEYGSGRDGDCHAIGFYPRKGMITVYLMDGTSRYKELLPQLGKHTTSRVCLYIKRLDDIQLPVLEKIVERSFQYVIANGTTMGRVTG